MAGTKEYKSTSCLMHFIGCIMPDGLENIGSLFGMNFVSTNCTTMHVGTYEKVIAVGLIWHDAIKTQYDVWYTLFIIEIITDSCEDFVMYLEYKIRSWNT